MGVRLPSVASTAITNPLPSTAIETVICTLPPLNIPLDFAQILLFWFASITLAGNGANLTMRLRRGTTTSGATVGTGGWGVTAAASTLVILSGCYPDTPGAIAGQQYCLTCLQAGNTVAGTVNDVAMIALVL
jgi:hypothetical protein